MTNAEMSTSDQLLDVDVLRALDYPVDVPLFLRKRRLLKKILLEKTPAVEPLFYESEYGRFSEDALFANPELEAFQPRIVYIHRPVKTRPAGLFGRSPLRPIMHRAINILRGLREQHS
jgi:hypothetical protein